MFRRLRHRVWQALAIVLALAVLAGSQSMALAQEAASSAAPEEPPVARVVGGRLVTDVDDWPFMAAMVDDTMFPSSQRCGGSVIAPTWVLTAAHCFYDREGNRTYFAEHVSWLLGALNVEDVDNPIPSTAIRIPSDEVVIHPGYDPETLENDIALVRLASPWHGGTVRVAVPPNESLRAAGMPATMKGWGTTTQDGQGSPDLLEGEVPLISDEECSDELGPVFVADVMLCAGNLDGGDVGPCFGDSGGPLAVANPNGGWIQAGIMSWVFSCVPPLAPAGYTDVATYRTWLEDIVTDLNQAPQPADDFAVVVDGGVVQGSVLENDHDPDGDLLWAYLVENPSHGFVDMIEDGVFTYQHSGDGSTEDSFAYLAWDGFDLVRASVSIEVVPADNAPPLAGDDFYEVTNGGTVNGSVLDNDWDPDGDALTAWVIDPPGGDLVLGPDGSFTYTHDGWSGDDSFTYVASDGLADSNVATVTIVVLPAGNEAPVAVDDGYDVKHGGTVNGSVLDNDWDPDGDALTAWVVDAPAGGLKLRPDGTFTYTHDGKTQVDEFTYYAFDGLDFSDTATVTITASSPPRPQPKPQPQPKPGPDPKPDPGPIPQPGPGPDPEPDGDKAAGPVTVGLVDPAQGLWHLRNSAGEETSFFFGNPGDIPFMGDWDCDGIATPGLFRTSDAYAYLSNANRSQVADIRFFFGNPSDIPLAGDFNGDGCDTLSIYRPSEQRFFIMNELGADEGGLGAADFSFGFGDAGDKPVVGDWDGDGIDEIGLHRESTGFFYWRETLETGIADGAIFFGDPGDRFVAGDWGTKDGADTPAVFRPSATTVYYRYTLTQGGADAEQAFGQPGWLPVAGAFGLG